MNKYAVAFAIAIFGLATAAEAKTINVQVEIVDHAPKGLRKTSGQHVLQNQGCNGPGTIGRMKNPSGGYDYYRCR